MIKNNFILMEDNKSGSDDNKRGSGPNLLGLGDYVLDSQALKGLFPEALPPAFGLDQAEPILSKNVAIHGGEKVMKFVRFGKFRKKG